MVKGHRHETPQSCRLVASVHEHHFDRFYVERSNKPPSILQKIAAEIPFRFKTLTNSAPHESTQANKPGAAPFSSLPLSGPLG
jgi:hypothetical protein